MDKRSGSGSGASAAGGTLQELLQEKEAKLEEVKKTLGGLKSLLNQAKSGSSQGDEYEQATIQQLLFLRTEEAAGLTSAIAKLKENAPKLVRETRESVEELPPSKRTQLTIFASFGISPRFASSDSESTSTCSGCKKDCVKPRD